MNPHVAGNNLPIYSSAAGSISTGNIMPESIIEGRKMSCETIVSLELLLTVTPNIVPIIIQAAINRARIKRNKPTCSGITASKAIGAIKTISRLTRNK
ncbi:hypothetical protein D3C74_403190 [compost metagenome]